MKDQTRFNAVFHVRTALSSFHVCVIFHAPQVGFLLYLLPWNKRMKFYDRLISTYYSSLFS